MKLYFKRGVQTVVSLICALALISSCLPIQAEDAASLENKTSDLQQQLSGINQELLAISNEIAATEMQIEITNSEILRTADSLAVAEANEAQQYEDMKTRIKYMYETDNASLLEMLFSAESMSDFLNKAEFIQNISDYDRNMLTELQAIQASIAAQKATMEEQQASMLSLQNDLEIRKTQLVQKAEATSTDLAVFNAQLQQLRAEEAARAAAEAAAAQAAAQAAAAQAAQASAQANTPADTGSQVPSGSDTVPADTSIINDEPVNISGSELDIFAAILECEAMQDYTSLLAVATVIMNRVNSPRFPDTISGVVYAGGQFEPVWTGRLDACLSRGPSALSYQVAQDALNGARVAAVADCYYFLYAGSTTRPGVNIGNNLFFQGW